MYKATDNSHSMDWWHPNKVFIEFGIDLASETSRDKKQLKKKKALQVINCLQTVEENLQWEPVLWKLLGFLGDGWSDLSGPFCALLVTGT